MMLKIHFTLIFLFIINLMSFAQSFINDQLNSFTNGVNQEFQDKEEVIQIGSALYNVNTNEIIAIKFVEDELNEGVEEELLGRFLSVDPLTSEFSFYTPYQYAGNKPIAAIDLDGHGRICCCKVV